VAALLPIMAVVLIGFLVIGLALPVLPLRDPACARAQARPGRYRS
jgi:hypothetical protein